MVTGGYDFSELASTEIFIEGSSQWTEAGTLPPKIGIQTTTTTTTTTTTKRHQQHMLIRTIESIKINWLIWRYSTFTKAK